MIRDEEYGLVSGWEELRMLRRLDNDMRVHNCGHIGCHHKIAMNQRYCDEHKGEHENTIGTRINNHYYNQFKRDPVANAFYHDKRWLEMRDYVYARDMGVCQCCGEVVTDRKIVDHIHPLKIASDERLNGNNLWTLCYDCHNIKTMIEQQTLEKSNGVNKLKHISRDWYVKQIMRLKRSN